MSSAAAASGAPTAQGDYLRQLQVAIHSRHHCGSLHACTNVVNILFDGGRSWSGEVETFHLIDHPQAQRCYAWGFLYQRRFRSSIVLELPPVDSPSSAVHLTMMRRPIGR